MRLTSLIEGLPESMAALEWRRSDAIDDPTIRGIRYDSRSVSPGDLFVAMRGANSDGHDYLERAVALGAAALLVEEMPSDAIRKDLPTVRVADARRAMAPLAARFFGHPADELNLVGITGTNGKTSTSYLVESILAHAGLRVGLVGTVEIRYADTHEVSVNTTPESPRSPANASRDANGTDRCSRDGGLFARPRTRTRAELCIQSCGLHESLSGPSRFPWLYGRLSRFQGKTLQ